MTSIILFFISALAAPADTWQGSWILDVQASDFGMMPAPDSGLTVFARADDRLVMTRTIWTSQRGHQTVEFDQATDGEYGAGSSSRGNEIPSRVWWEGEVMVVEVEVESNQGEIIVTDYMSLTDDDTITLERTLDVEAMDDELEMTYVYRRQ
jgi:hypothetical protein